MSRNDTCEAHTLPARHHIAANVAAALREDLGHGASQGVVVGDPTAALVPADEPIAARVIVREAALLCGRAWFDETLRQVDPALACRWHFADGEVLAADEVVCELSGPARSLLTAERTALNFLQLLSGTATVTARHAQRVAHTRTRILDTRKTIPGLRLAQKYAVRCGGGSNHRIGLYDAILIKENHIAAAGSISAAVERARTQAPGLTVEVEVENLTQYREALAAAPERIMLDNFALADLERAVAERVPGIDLEASGGIEGDRLAAVAETGVDFVSIGALTKHLRAVDFSLRVVSR